MIHYIFDEFFHVISYMKTTYPFDDFNNISLFDLSMALLFVSIVITIFFGGSDNAE